MVGILSTVLSVIKSDDNEHYLEGEGWSRMFGEVCILSSGLALEHLKRITMDYKTSGLNVTTEVI